MSTRSAAKPHPSPPTAASVPASLLLAVLQLTTLLLGTACLSVALIQPAWERVSALLFPPEALDHPIGAVQSLRGFSRLQAATALGWNDMIRGRPYPVQDGDQVATGEGSGARIELGQAGASGLAVAKVGPMSLVVLRRPAQGQSGSLKLARGATEIQLARGAAPLEIQWNQKLLYLSVDRGAAPHAISQVQLLDQGKQLQIQNDSGVPTDLVWKESRSGQSGHVILEGHQNALLQASGSLSFAPALQATWMPEGGATVVLGEDETHVPFKLDLPKNATQAPKQIQIDQEDAERASLAHPQELTYSIELPLQEGAHRWRVWYKPKAATTGDLFVSPWRSLSVRRLQAPLTMGPVEHSQHRALGDKTPVHLSWKPVEAPLEVQVSWQGPLPPGQTDWSKLEEKQEAGSWKGWVLQAKQGLYRWRTRVAEPGTKRTSKWGPWGTFEVVPSTSAEVTPGLGSLIATDHRANAATAPAAVPALPPVKPAKPAQAKLSTKFEILPSLAAEGASGSTRLSEDSKLNEVPIQVRWKAIPGVKTYHIRVYAAEGEATDSPALEQDLSVPQFTVKVTATSAKSYRYEVEAELPTGEWIRSQRVPVVLELAPPIPKTPEMGAKLDAAPNLILTWEKTSLTQSYDLQISRTRDFKQTEVNQSLKVNYQVVDLPAGKHYWRVRSLSAGKTSPWSTTFEFTTGGAPPSESESE